MPHRPYRLGKMLSPAIFQIVAVDRGDDDMVQAQRLNRMGNSARFEDVKRIGPTGRDIAERTAACADLAHDHHGRVTGRPAFADIGAAGLFADRHELVRAQDIARLLVTSRGRGLDPDPVGLFRLRLIRPVGFFRMTLVRNSEVAHELFPLTGGRVGDMPFFSETQ